MTNFIEPYAKDKNLLQLCLFYFGKRRPVPKETLVEWTDTQGEYSLKCTCSYGVPGSLEQDVYTATMRLWVQQGMKRNGITLNYSDIARALGLEPKHWVGKIKKSLQKLAQARYEFNQCFILAEKNGAPEKINTHFSLYDSASLFDWSQSKSKKNSQSYLIFPWEIQQNLEAKYYQVLDLTWYRKLPEGLPRRLYEYLEKRKYHSSNNTFIVSEKFLCRWLPIKDKHVTKRRKRLERIARELIQAGYLKNYIFDKNKKQCIFDYKISEARSVKPVSIKVNTTKKIDTTDKTESVYSEAIGWLDTIPYFHKKRKEEIASMSAEEVVQCYPGIRSKYEKMLKKPGPGWIYQAFKKRYIFVEDIQRQQQEKRDNQKREREKYIDNVKSLVQKNGGIGAAKYCGDIVSHITEAGLVLGGSSVLLWDHIIEQGFE